MRREQAPKKDQLREQRERRKNDRTTCDPEGELTNIDAQDGLVVLGSGGSGGGGVRHDVAMETAVVL